MRIAAINKNLSIGGGELLMTLLAEETVKNGHSFDIFLFEKKINYQSANLAIKFVSPFSSLSPLFRIVLTPYFFVYLLIKLRRYDVILSFERYPAYLNMIIALILHKKSMIYLQNPIDESFGSIYKNKLIRNSHIFLHSLVFQNADIIVTVSNGIKKELIDIFKISGNKITVIEPWIDVELVKKLMKEKLTDEETKFLVNKMILISVGRLQKQKNFAGLIKIFNIVSKKIKNSRLVIVGDGPEMTSLVRMIERYGLKHKVLLTGYQNNPFKYMKRSDVFALPSFFEGYPHVLLEALACNLKIVVADSPFGIRELSTSFRDNVTLVANNRKLINNMAVEVISILKHHQLNRFYENSQRIFTINNDRKKEKWLKLLKNI